MRIIAGRFKGHRLVAFKAPHIRPTTDRVKETIFNKIAFDIPGAEVLDLFSGTGNLGLEALSRGAAHVTFVEKHKKSISILNQNIRKLEVASEVDVLPLDVFQFLKNQNKKYEIVLVDPPFTQAIADKVMQAISGADLVLAEGKVLIEASSQEFIGESYPGYQLLDKKAFGDKSLSIFQRHG